MMTYNMKIIILRIYTIFFPWTYDL